MTEPGTPPLRVVALGVGGAFSALHHSTTLALGYGEEWLLLDCPHPIRKILAESRERVADLPDAEHFAAVVITHCHADHCSGLEGMGFYNYFVAEKRTVVVADPEVAERLWDGHLSAGMSSPINGNAGTFEEFFEHVPLTTTQEVAVGSFTIRARRTIHPVPTTALLVSAGGRTLGYSADTEYDPDLIEWLDQADLVLHETGKAIHTPLELLEALPGRIREKLALVHYTDDVHQGMTPLKVLVEGDELIV